MLAYDTRGDGENPWLLLHGFLGSGRNLASLARRWSSLDPHAKFILPDLTGHGTSPALVGESGLKSMARDVIALAAALHVPTPLRLVGHSMGGRVALTARLCDPAAVGEVVLLDIAPGPMAKRTGDLHDLIDRLMVAPDTTASREQMRAFFVDDGIAPPLADWVLMNLVFEAGVYRWRIDRARLGAMHQREADVDLWEAVEMAGAGASTRCIRGGASSFVSDADVSRLEKAGVAVQTLPGAGHFVHVDAQAALLDCLTRPA